MRNVNPNPSLLWLHGALYTSVEGLILTAGSYSLPDGVRVLGGKCYPLGVSEWLVLPPKKLSPALQVLVFLSEQHDQLWEPMIVTVSVYSQ